MSTPCLNIGVAESRHKNLPQVIMTRPFWLVTHCIALLVGNILPFRWQQLLPCLHLALWLATNIHLFTKRVREYQ